MDVLSVAKKIEEAIKLIDAGRKGIDKLAEDKADMSGYYEKTLAITIMKLKNGVGMELDGECIQSPPATIIEKIARGMCWKEKIASEKSEALYKAHIEKLECVRAMLNGYQSINRHLSEN